MLIDIDNLIILTFLIITFIAGIRHAKGIKTMSDYALGGRNFSTGVIVATLVATSVSGSGFFIDLSNTYFDGLYYLIAASAMSLSFLITGFFFIPRMGEFLGHHSVAESMGSLYGQEVRIITAIAGIIASVGFIAVQFKVFGNLFSYFLGFSSAEAILISSVLVTIYSAFGGIKSVTFTDIIQIITFGIAIPIIGIMIWNKFHYDGLSFANSLSDPKFSFSEVFNLGNPKFLQMIPLLLYFSFPSISHVDYQRILMGRDLNQMKKVFIITAGLLLIILFITAWIPFLIFNVDSNLVPNQLLGYIIDNYTYVGLKGLIIAGIVAMAMSTADSYINTSSVLFSNDICTPLNVGKNKELLLSKIFAFVLGGVGIILALSTQDLLSIILAANSFNMPIVSIPLIFSILGFRSSTKSVLIGMSAGFVTVVVWKILAIETDCIVFAMLANLIFLMGSHYLLRQKGGWVGIKDKAAFEQLKQTELKQRTESLRRFRNINFVGYCRKNFPNNELSYVGLGVYLMIYAVSTMYSTRAELLKENAQMILIFYQILLVSGTILFVYPIWPRGIEFTKKQTFAQCVWPIVISGTLIFFNTFFLIVSNFNGVQFGMFTMNLLIASILLGWRIFVICAVSGLYLAFELHQIYNPNYIFDIELGSPAFIAIYTSMLIGASTILFIKPRQEKLEKTEEKVDTLEIEVIHLDHEVTNLHGKVTDLSDTVTHYSERVSDQEKEIERLGATAQKILNNVNHELRLPVGNVMNFAEMLNEGLDKFNADQLKMLSDEVYKNSNRLSSMIMNMLDLATLNAKKLELNKKIINLSELVEDRVRNCRKVYLENKKLDFKLEIHPDIFISVDPNYIRQVVDNLVINAIKFSKEGVINIKLLKKKNIIEFTIKDKGIGIPQNDLYDIFTPFKMGSNTESKAEGRGVGLALCKAAIEAHGGMITVESKGVGALFRFVLHSDN
jgi:Na+/proline symporter/signal transduction histidine kinase